MTCPCPHCGMLPEMDRPELQYNVVTFNGVKVGLSPTQAEIARALLNRFGRWTERESLLCAVGSKTVATWADERAMINYHIHILRKKLRALGLYVEGVQSAGWSYRVTHERQTKWIVNPQVKGGIVIERLKQLNPDAKAIGGEE